MIKVILYFIALILLVAQINKINPQWLDLKSNSIVDGPRLYPGIPLPFKVSDHPGLEVPTFQYRGDIQRTGVTSQRLKLPLRSQARLEHRNYGIHGASKSSISVDEWGIFFPTDSSWVYHYDHNNKLQWKYFVSESVRGIHGTAVMTKNVVYFGAYNGRFYALNRKTGKPIWVYKLGGAIGASPVLWRDHIYIAVERTDVVDGYLVKLKALTGELVWKSDDIGEQAHSSPAIDPNIGMIYFGANNEKFFAMSDRDGSIEWEYKANGPIKGTPVVTKNCVAFSDWSGLIYCLRLATGKLKWTSNIKVKTQSSPTYIKDINRIIVSANQGYIFSLNSSDGKIMWEKKVDSPIMMASATAFKNQKDRWHALTTCGKNHLCIYDILTGQEKQKLETESLVTSVPSLFAGKAFITSSKGYGQIFKSNDQ